LKFKSWQSSRQNLEKIGGWLFPVKHYWVMRWKFQWSCTSKCLPQPEVVTLGVWAPALQDVTSIKCLWGLLFTLKTWLQWWKILFSWVQI
jgi:hypothetical protein